MNITVTLEESDRQMVLLALARLAVDRPGWDFAAGIVADLLEGRYMFDMLKKFKAEGDRTL